MSTRTRTEITIETERIVSISWRPTALAAWCTHCQAQVPVVTAQQAVLLLHVSLLVLHQLVETEQLHSLRECEGLLLICLPSLYHCN